MKSVERLTIELVSDRRLDAAGLETYGGWAGYLRSFLLTVAIELAVAALLLRRLDRRLVVAMVVVNLLTHPALTLALREGRLAEPLGEALVVLVEWPLDRWLIGIPWRRALLVAVATNLVSWGAGFLL